MSGYLLIVALVLLLTMVVGLIYLARVADPSNAVLVALLFGTTGVAITLTLGYALGIPGAIDVALVLALLSAILGVTFVLRGTPGSDREVPRS